VVTFDGGKNMKKSLTIILLILLSFSAAAQNFDIDLNKGWNFMKVNSDMINFSVEDFKGDCNIQKVLLLDLFLKKFLNKDFRLNDVGKILIIAAKEKCTLRKEEPYILPEPPRRPRQPTRGLCKDSDNGLNYNREGYVKIRGNLDYGHYGRKYDVCLDNNMLVEYYCQSKNDPGSKTKICEKGCKKGACVTQLIECQDSDKCITFTNQENIYYQFPFNNDKYKIIYTEKELLYLGNIFILSTCTETNLNCFTKVFNYKDADVFNRILYFQDIGTGGNIEVVYNEEGKGNLIAGGHTYTFLVSNSSSTYLKFDLNGNGEINETDYVLIGTKGKQLIDLRSYEEKNSFCNDSDEGKDPFAFGKVTWQRENGLGGWDKDHCSSIELNILNERYCEELQSKETKIVCENGCKDGACISSDSIYEKEYLSCQDSDGNNIYEYGVIKFFTADGTGYIEKEHCASPDYLNERYCEGTKPKIKTTFCQNGCETGACIEDVPPKLTCTDSDEGENFYEKGTTTGVVAWWDAVQENVKQHEDYCTTICQGSVGSGKSEEGPCLLEFSCQEHSKRQDGKVYAGFTVKKCENGCKDGVCVQKKEYTCIDSDGGKNLFEAGRAQGSDGNGSFDACNYWTDDTKGVISEAICTDTQTTHIDLRCPEEKPYCNRAVCSAIAPECTDSDGGININVLGTAMNPKLEKEYPATDYCENIKTRRPWNDCKGAECGIREFFCHPTKPVWTYQDIACPQGCKDGVCLPNPAAVVSIQNNVSELVNTVN